MGQWDALGRGFEVATQAFLARQQRLAEQEQAERDRALQEAQLRFNQGLAMSSRDLEEARQATEEQARNEAKYKELWANIPEKGIVVPMYRQLGQGSYVPTTDEERQRQLREGLAAWETAHPSTDLSFEQRKELERLRAELDLKNALAQKAPAAPDPLDQLIQDGKLNPEAAYRFLNQYINTYHAGYPATFWADDEAARASKERLIENVRLRWGEAAKQLFAQWLYNAAPPSPMFGAVRQPPEIVTQQRLQAQNVPPPPSTFSPRQLETMGILPTTQLPGQAPLPEAMSRVLSGASGLPGIKTPTEFLKDIMINYPALSPKAQQDLAMKEYQDYLAGKR